MTTTRADDRCRPANRFVSGFGVRPDGTTYAVVIAMPLAIFLLCLVPVTACAQTPSEPTVTMNAEFTLAPGESARIEDTGLTVRFDGVENDSRCPANATCAQEGNATVRVTVSDGGSTREYTLKTDEGTTAHEGMTITLVQLAPYPLSAEKIPPDEYRATLKVTR